MAFKKLASHKIEQRVRMLTDNYELFIINTVVQLNALLNELLKKFKKKIIVGVVHKKLLNRLVQVLLDNIKKQARLNEITSIL